MEVGIWFYIAAGDVDSASFPQSALSPCDLYHSLTTFSHFHSYFFQASKIPSLRTVHLFLSVSLGNSYWNKGRLNLNIPRFNNIWGRKEIRRGYNLFWIFTRSIAKYKLFCFILLGAMTVNDLCCTSYSGISSNTPNLRPISLVNDV